MRTIESRSIRTWAIVLGVMAVIGGSCSKPPEPPPAPSDPEDIAEQVHNFCGGSCHAYPPADSFPRKVWRTEVERGFRFFERSGLPLKVPPFESVVRYYEKQAPEELPRADCPRAGHPLGVRFERLTYPNTPNTPHPAISHVNLVRLPASGKVTGREPLAILACGMSNGRVLLLRPTDPKPEWQILAQLKNPAHAEVVDLDQDGIADILVADLGSFPPTERRCGSVVWLRGKGDGTFTPFTLLDDVVGNFSAPTTQNPVIIWKNLGK